VSRKIIQKSKWHIDFTILISIMLSGDYLPLLLHHHEIPSLLIKPITQRIACCGSISPSWFSLWILKGACHEA
jgi:hypothetical protein